MCQSDDVIYHKCSELPTKIHINYSNLCKNKKFEAPFKTLSK